MNPLDYSLCNQTVTLYRKEGNGVKRQVLTDCHLSASVSTPTERYGKSLEKKFRLIIPGDRPVYCGDRIYAGIGPEVADWHSFVPAAVPMLYEVSTAKPCYWEGEITHWEVGNRKEHL